MSDIHSLSQSEQLASMPWSPRGWWLPQGQPPQSHTMSLKLGVFTRVHRGTTTPVTIQSSATFTEGPLPSGKGSICRPSDYLTARTNSGALQQLWRVEGSCLIGWEPCRMGINGARWACGQQRLPRPNFRVRPSTGGWGPPWLGR